MPRCTSSRVRFFFVCEHQAIQVACVLTIAAQASYKSTHQDDAHRPAAKLPQLRATPRLKARWGMVLSGARQASVPRMPHWILAWLSGRACCYACCRHACCVACRVIVLQAQPSATGLVP
jgi:hypothetical protein